MPVVVAAQKKGGVGKTMLILNLASQAARRNKTAVLDVDVDQGASADWGEIRKLKHPELPRIDVYLTRAFEVQKKVDGLKAEGVKWIFIDLPGLDNPSISAGLNVSDFALVPCRPLVSDIKPSIKTVGLIRRGGGRYAYVMNVALKRRAEKVSAALAREGYVVAPPIITEKVGVPDAVAEGMGINESEPGCESAKEFEALFKWLEKQVK
jgi:cellulose biosynthesis protein BcsQ